MVKQNAKTSSLGPKDRETLRMLRCEMNSTSDELRRLTDIVKLAAFACEARRVLVGVSDAFRHDCDNALKDKITNWVAAPLQWEELEDTASSVLVEVGDQLDALAELTDKAILRFPDLSGGAEV